MGDKTNADVIRQMDNNQLAEFLREFEFGGVHYEITFCYLCRKDGNVLNLDCDGCLKHWLDNSAEDVFGLLYNSYKCNRKDG